MAAQYRSATDSELVFEISGLGRRAGAMMTKDVTVSAPGDLGIDMIGVPEGSQIALDLKFESVIEGVWVSGTADVSLEGTCSRCLAELEYDEFYELQELYFWPDKEAEEDVSRVVDDTVDLDIALRDAVVLSLPFAPLCQDDCLGLCSECGANLNEDPDHDHGPKTDARWDRLKELFPDLSEMANQDETE